jgi:hypothetical protein
VRRKLEPFGNAGRLPGAARAGEGGKVRRPGRALAVFRAVVLLALLAVTAYGTIEGGLYDSELWLPAAAGILGVLLATLFVRGYYEDVPRAGWAMVALLAALVAIKGLSMIWTVSETETVEEILRSSMYLATFATALAAASPSGRQAGALTDFAVLIVSAVAGYGLLQKISPTEYPVLSFDGVRIDSTLGYANTTAAVLGMGIVLSLGRMAGMRNAVFRGLYAALVLAFLVVLYLTISRGGLASLGVGGLLLLVLARERLQVVANLMLVGVPGTWLLWRIQNLEGLLLVDASEAQKVAAGAAFRNDLILALAVAFILQAGYSLLLDRYEPTVQFRRIAWALVLGGAVLVVASGVFLVVDRYGGARQAYEKLTSDPAQTENAGRRLGSLSAGYRAEYWKVAWEDWKQHPLTGTGAGTFRYTWLQERSDTNDVRQVHNLYLEQLTEIGVFGFLALLGFAGLLVGHTARAAWRSSESAGENGPLLAGLVAALVVYLVSSILEWHWYIPAATLFFFVLAAVAVRLAAGEDHAAEPSARPAAGEAPQD